MAEDDKKIRRCKFSFGHIRGSQYEYHCVEAGWEDDKVVITDEDKCEACKKFISRYIEYPITVNNIEDEKIKYNEDTFQGAIGSICAVRPCNDEYKGKTYLGFYLGDLPVFPRISFNNTQGVLKIRTGNNPAIFVPELHRIVFGYESWWRTIETDKDLMEITDKDIDKQWYVQCLKAIDNK